MSAVIAGLVVFAVGNSIFKTQEGSISGCFSVVCVCIWNGFFNSIQSVCRERNIVKREHRAGMHISSYIAAHMIYQFLLCAAQTAILLGVCSLAKVSFPKEGLITRWFMADLAISLFLITYAADMMSLAISCLVRNTTTAMTMMPFMLIFQLVFSGNMVQLQGNAQLITDLTITKWGMRSVCTLGNYNDQPMVTLWNTVYKFRELEVMGRKPIELLTNEVMDQGWLDKFLKYSGEYNQRAEYLYTAGNIWECWGHLILIIVLFACLAVALLELVDRDKR